MCALYLLYQYILCELYYLYSLYELLQLQKGCPGQMYFIPIIFIIAIMWIILIYQLYVLLQVRQDLGLADHVWQDKRTLIAQSVDNLGDQFRPAMRAGCFPTSVVCTEMRTVRPVSALLWEKAPWWLMIESTPLLDAANTVLP